MTEEQLAVLKKWQHLSNANKKRQWNYEGSPKVIKEITNKKKKLANTVYNSEKYRLT